jgi:hypothetical protein
LSDEPLPAEAAIDRESLSHFCVRSAVVVPLLLHDRIVPEDLAAWEQHERVHHQGRRPGQLQFRIRRQDGQIIWLDHLCRPILDARGEFLGTRVSTRDVTERKEMEIRLETALTEITSLKERLEKENLGLRDILKTERNQGAVHGTTSRWSE